MASSWGVAGFCASEALAAGEWVKGGAHSVVASTYGCEKWTTSWQWQYSPSLDLCGKWASQHPWFAWHQSRLHEHTRVQSHRPRSEGRFAWFNALLLRS